MSRARLSWILGFAVVATGFVPVLLFALGTLLPGAEGPTMLGFFPDLPWLGDAQAWLYAHRIKWSPSAGLVFALLGIAIMYFGAFLAKSQEAALQAMRARTQDARRRRQQYGSMNRIEPTLN